MAPLLTAVVALTLIGSVAVSKITKNVVVGIIGVIMLMVAFAIGLEVAQQISEINMSVLP